MLCPSCGRENRLGATFCDSCAIRLDDSAGDVAPNDFATSADFVGRQRELGELVSALDDTFAGKGRLVMLVGEPGIGKTRLAQELADIAERRGAQIFWGRCYEQQGAPPYWPWVQVIRSYIQQANPDEILSIIGPGSADIAEIVPQLKQVLPDLITPPTLEPDSARFRLFDSITTFLKNASSTSGGQPILIVLDDLHWSDRPSLLLLEFLARELVDIHMLIVATYRDVDLSRGHPLTLSLGELTRQRSFHRLSIRGLTQDDVGTFIEAASDIVTGPELVEAIYSRSEGNPLFVEEMVRLLSEEGGEWSGRIPEGIREVIGRRLDRLSEDGNRALTIASVIGNEFGFDLLGRLVEGLSTSALLAELEAAQAIGVIEEVEDAVGRYRFSHALIQQTLISELSTTRRVGMHARIAEALEQILERNLEAHAAELAFHFEEAQTLLGSEKMIRYSLLAGEQAMSSYAWEDAQAHFERALAAKEEQAMDAETAAIVSGLGHALAALGQHEQAATNLKRAFAHYAEVGDVTRAVATVDSPRNMFLNMFMKDTLAQALDLVPAGSLQSARLLCSFGLSVGTRGNGYAEGQTALEGSLAIARCEGDIALEMRVMAAYANVDGMHMKWQQSLEKSLRALELSTQVDDDLIDKLRAHSWACQSSFAIGDPKRAGEHSAEMYVIAESLRNVYWLEQALGRRRVLAYLSGEWEALHALGDRYANGVSNAVLAMALYQTGEFDKGKAYMDAVIGRGTRTDMTGALRSLVAACFHYISGEADLLTEVEAAAGDAIANPELWPNYAWDAQAALALVAVLRHEASSAAEQYSVLEPYANTVTRDVAICADRLLGLLAQTMGNLNQAAAHFEDALDFCRKAGYRPDLAWSCYDYANMLIGADSKPAPIDVREKVSSLIEEALALSTELGMKPLMERVIGLKLQIEAQPAPKPTYPDGLTGREVEVLRLVASGRSNREIGEQLFIALNTVARHVSNIFSKTDSSNRAEAATYANQHDLLL